MASHRAQPWRRHYVQFFVLPYTTSFFNSYNAFVCNIYSFASILRRKIQKSACIPYKIFHRTERKKVIRTYSHENFFFHHFCSRQGFDIPTSNCTVTTNFHEILFIKKIIIHLLGYSVETNNIDFQEDVCITSNITRTFGLSYSRSS